MNQPIGDRTKGTLDACFEVCAVDSAKRFGKTFGCGIAIFELRIKLKKTTETETGKAKRAAAAMHDVIAAAALGLHGARAHPVVRPLNQATLSSAG
ncbi:hypothetical protein [Paraburkholderia sp.]|uniref:hypothetical protein n=1 Tax=Paraburkholderia sp. TaxID=1926495 RepID=UPI0025D147A7|nr:hypothetical protein [Paraburkholderia sp.]